MEPDVGGYALPLAFKPAIKVFAQVVEDVPDLGWQVRDFSAYVVPGYEWTWDCGGPAERLIQVSSDSRQIVRAADDITFSALRASEILAVSNTTTPLDGTSVTPTQQGGSSLFKLLVRYSTNSGFSRFMMDVGQSIEFFARAVNIQLVGPTNVVVDAQNNSTATAEEMAVDALINVAVRPTGTARSLTEVRFTQHLLTEDDELVVLVPNMARKAKIYGADPEGTYSALRYIGNPVTRTVDQVVGSFNFTAAVSSDDSNQLGDENYLEITHAAEEAPGVTVVWTIQP